MLFFYMTSEFIHITLKIRDVKHIICHDWRLLKNNKDYLWIMQYDMPPPC